MFPNLQYGSSHPLNRRTLLEAGSLGLLGLSTTQLAGWQQAARAGTSRPRKSVIFLFLTGGLGQHDSFDMKPDAPVEVRGEFNPISTQTPGVQI